jgi:ribosomal protein S18 acetylase RimI-like enzyme
MVSKGITAMDVQIRYASEDDIDILVGMWKSFMWGDFAECSNLRMSETNIKKWRNLADLSIKQKMIQVAEVEDRIIGFILLNYGSQPFETIYPCALVLELYVDPEYRRRGFGSRLLYEGIAHAKELGYEVIALNVLCKNKEALCLYEKEGFEQVFYTLKKKI